MHEQVLFCVAKVWRRLESSDPPTPRGALWRHQRRRSKRNGDENILLSPTVPIQPCAPPNRAKVLARSQKSSGRTLTRRGGWFCRSTKCLTRRVRSAISLLCSLFVSSIVLVVHSSEDFRRLGRHLDEIMLGKADVPYEKIMMQLDSTTGLYEDSGAQNMGFKGATLRYRKMQNLDHSQVIMKYLRKPIFEQACRRLYGGAPIASFRTMFFNKPSRLSESIAGGTNLPWHQVPSCTSSTPHFPSDLSVRGCSSPLPFACPSRTRPFPRRLCRIDGSFSTATHC